MSIQWYDNKGLFVTLLMYYVWFTHSYHTPHVLCLIHTLLSHSSCIMPDSHTLITLLCIMPDSHTLITLLMYYAWFTLLSHSSCIMPDSHSYHTPHVLCLIHTLLSHSSCIMDTYYRVEKVICICAWWGRGALRHLELAPSIHTLSMLVSLYSVLTCHLVKLGEESMMERFLMKAVVYSWKQLSALDVNCLVDRMINGIIIDG